MAGRINRHGLKDSDLRESQRREIRRDAGYGCVICGALFIQYEHIEPEFHDAKKHESDKMTLLCGSHHDDVSYGRITKKMVWDAKANPKNKPGGKISRSLYHQNSDTNIIIGSSSLGQVGLKLFDSILTIKGKPVLWFESDFEPDSPVEVCAIFHDPDGKPHAFINRNCFETAVADYDIKGKGARITISKDRAVLLKLNFEGGETLKIERLKMYYKNVSIEVNTDELIKFRSSDFSCDFKLTTRQMSFGEPDITRCVDGFRLAAVHLAVLSAINGVRVLSHNGFTLGWIIGEFVLNKDYYIVAQIEGADLRVNDLSGECIGFLSESKAHEEKIVSIVTQNDFYESGEPIWLIPSEKMSRNVKNEETYDLGYRVFVDKYAYPWGIKK
ncbi:hypothetical protein FMJ21_13215 [Klebsiella grimontii]|uniref:hypothetical protein n=1 Tax=Klebsiella grimontii TaxID=2058152 RepID=UPI001CCB7262|nr:hypothetical protein [Klebsiella grimontii]MBZ7408195.1 hypothetical protein [Klebsiella grimontii]